MSGIDWDFIAGLEGRRLTAYVPTDGSGEPLGKSGVTVSCGVDLGQMSRDQIKALGLPTGLTARLLPYAGLRGHIAEDTLRALPLRLSPDEADVLAEVVRAGIIAQLARSYDEVAATCAGARFAQIPAACRTVLASVAFQYGSRLDARCPKFWRLAIAGGWPEMATELDNFGDAFPTRRRAEAAYLRRNLAAADA